MLRTVGLQRESFRVEILPRGVDIEKCFKVHLNLISHLNPLGVSLTAAAYGSWTIVLYQY